MSAERDRARLERELGPVGPWHTVIKVWALETNHGRQSTIPQDHVFEVTAEWFGPPAIGFPLSSAPVSSRDTYVLPNLDDAFRLAHAAAAEFAKGGDHPPDLRVLAHPELDTK